VDETESPAKAAILVLDDEEAPETAAVVITGRATLQHDEEQTHA